MSKEPSESWYQLLMSAHYELKQFKSVAGVLKILTTKYPKISVTGLNCLVFTWS